MEFPLEAYLDIETTGLSHKHSETTVIRIHLCSGDDSKFIQIFGDDITAERVLDVLEGVDVN